jgi:hypothetical protein
VLDLAEVVERDFERRRRAMVEVANVVMPIHLEHGKLRLRPRPAHPDRVELFRHLEVLGARVELRRRRAFAVAAAVEGPAVIGALELVLDDLAKAELHAAMRAIIDKSADFVL